MQQHSEHPWEVFTIDNVFSGQTLNDLEEYVHLSLQNKHRRFSNDVKFKNAKEVNTDIADVIWKGILPHLPKAYISRDNCVWSFTGPTSHIMYSKITPEDGGFTIHTDTGCIYDTSQNQFSKFTVLIYLTDQYDGGQTTFYDDNFKKCFDIQPARGRVLVFDISRFHSGSPISHNEKLWIGTELVCSKVHK